MTMTTSPKFSAFILFLSHNTLRISMVSRGIAKYMVIYESNYREWVKGQRMFPYFNLTTCCKVASFILIALSRTIGASMFWCWIVAASSSFLSSLTTGYTARAVGSPCPPNSIDSTWTKITVTVLIVSSRTIGASMCWRWIIAASSSFLRSLTTGYTARAVGSPGSPNSIDWKWSTC